MSFGAMLVLARIVRSIADKGILGLVHIMIIMCSLCYNVILTNYHLQYAQ